MRKLPRRAACAAAIIAATTLAVVSSTQTQLQFLGMNSVFGLSKHDKSGLLRQADCSITQYGFSVSTRMLIPATNFQDFLHQSAGLTTKSDVFAKGCKDPVLGVQSTHAAYLGKSPAGLYQGVQGATDHVADLVAYAASPSTLSFTSTTLATNVLPQVLGLDLNKDGFIDVVATGVKDSKTQKTGVGVFLSNGDGTFKSAVIYDMATSAEQAFVADDLNGDGIPDILVPNSSSGGNTQLTTLLGKGDGSFTIGPTTAISLTTPLSLYGLSQPIVTGDFNGDGKIDVITADGMMYPGNGDGSFGAGHQALSNGYYVVTAYAVGDFNGDGKLDLAELVTGINPSGTVIVFLGHGDGTFTQGFAYDSVPEGTAIVATDIDGDGILDLVVARSSNGLFSASGLGNQTTGNTWYYQVLMGRGDGTFSGAPVTLPGATGISTTSYALADFTKDGRLDLLAPTAGTNVGPAPSSLTVVPGVGNGSFVSPTVSPTNLIPRVVAAADLNGDGNADSVVLGDTPSGSASVGVLFGNGSGALSGELDYPLPADGSAVQVGDFNGDGLPDIAVAVNCSTPCAAGVYVLYGQANHTFSAPALINASPALIDGGTQMYLAAGDINGDGIADLVVVNGGFLSGNGLTTPGVIHVYLGKANNSFASSTPAVPGLYITDVALADLNKDGKLDIVIGASDQNFNTQVDVLLGHGDGSFATAHQTLIAGGIADPSPLIAVADFDGDGNPDVAFFLAGDFSGVLFGAGDGTLPTQVKMPIFSPSLPSSPKAVDLNGDKRPDLIFADANVASLVSFINQWGAAAVGSTPTSTTLKVAPSPAAFGQSVTLTAAVSAASGAPTGSVQFLDGTSILGSSTLNAQDTATFTTTSLAAGTRSLTAQYGGDTTFAASTSGALSLTVTSGTPDFSITSVPALGSVGAGASATATLTLTPSNGFTGTVTLACSGLPAGAACSFSPVSVSLSAGAATSHLSISTAMRVARTMTRPAVDPLDPFIPSTALAGMMATFSLRRRSRSRRAARVFRWLGLLLVWGAVLQGCNGGSSGGARSPSGGTPAGTYTVTVTATSGSTSHTVPYALTVT
jgi:hypothetical protein